MFGLIGGLAGLVSGALGNRKAAGGMKNAQGYVNRGLGGAEGIGRDMRGLYGGAVQSGMFDWDRQVAKMNALSHKQEGIEGRSATGALTGAGYREGDGVFEDVTRAIASDNADRRDRMAHDMAVQNVMARMNILQGSMAPYNTMIQGGQGAYNMAASQQQNLGSFIPAIAQGLKDVFK